jgi:hypothetical protein
MWEIDEGDLSRFRCHVSHGSGRMALDENLRRLPASAPRWRGNYTIRQKNISHRLLAESWTEKLSPSARARSSAIRRACMT